MSIIENVTVVLDSLPEATVILISDEDGKPVNAAYRAPDKEGALTWALAGKPDPFTSESLAKIIVTRSLTWNEMEMAW